MANNFISDHTVDRYMADVSKYPLLTREQEATLAVQYRTHADLDAAHQLVVANLRFVVRVAHEYRGYNMNLLDLIQEGNIGLMMAVRKFDPARGFRLITYAVWWIRARIYEFILRSWSLVKVGGGRVSRKLFFKLRLTREIADREAADGSAASVDLLAEQLEVAGSDICAMANRLAGHDASLDVPIQDGAHETRLDLLRSTDPSQEDALSRTQEHQRVQGSIAKAVAGLNERESYIVKKRLMAEQPKTLQEIGQYLHVSRERARQIEGNVLRKIRVELVRSGNLERATA
jgi:RNA polymerase sigma-32 factor